MDLIKKGVGVKYIGDHQYHTDIHYGTGLTWAPGQVHNVSDDAAKNLLAHADVYEESELIVGDVMCVHVEEIPARVPPMLPPVERMGKKELRDYALSHFGENLHHAMSEENMRHKIVNLVGERGLS